MPELPEVETVRRGLEPVLAGRVLAHVEQRRADLRWPLPARFAERLTGRRVATVGRRSKYLLIGLEAGGTATEAATETPAETLAETPAETWLVHLGMSGRILVANGVMGAFHHTTPAPGPHDHVVVTTDRGETLTYNDARRFGAMDLWPTERIEAHPLLAALGPEPLSNAFNAAFLAAAFRGRRSSVKAALMDQRVVAGLGNIYVCEALHRARIRPARLAGSLSAARVGRLAAAIVATLTDAIAAGGSSLRDYRRTDGELGYFQHAFRVYDRAGAPCPGAGCRGTVRRIVQSARSTYYCPRCQR